MMSHLKSRKSMGIAFFFDEENMNEMFCIIHVIGMNTGRKVNDKGSLKSFSVFI